MYDYYLHILVNLIYIIISYLAYIICHITYFSSFPSFVTLSYKILLSVLLNFYISIHLIFLFQDYSLIL